MGASADIQSLRADIRRMQLREEDWVRLLTEDRAVFKDLTDEKNRLESEVEALREALTWIAKVNATDYEYQNVARAALAARPGEKR